ncbi:alpha-galactosidase [Spirosoma sp. KCTC 42546]|uniref:alpha-galactosidase n=1 Tax=Spirosoma sp. KCTC 42546 TaxID=2520506 RepID=UPI0011591ED4|nr:alpha-galactosidase [Spirosoma sp. KCTC 42546]QDK81971.1 alpha-galactosidase [Spirosoma sp. KCTC 42546]
MKPLLFIFFWFICLTSQSQSDLSNCQAIRKGDTLILGNSLIQRTYLFHNGNLSSLSITDKRTGKTWGLASKGVDFALPAKTGDPARGEFTVKTLAETPSTPAHLEAEVLVALGTVWVKRVFRIYPNCPAIACDYYLKGSASGWQEQVQQAYDLRNIESQAAQKEGESNTVVIDRLALPGPHWKGKSVEFFDATDQNNTLVQEYSRLAYRQEVRMRGNLLFLNEVGTDAGLFWLKEAPVSGVQLAYPGFDFSLKIGEARAAGVGMGPGDLRPDEWVRGYSLVLGVSSGGEQGQLAALRTYQQNLRVRKPNRDEMILLNTWGDRGQDKNINESFVLRELELGAKLGITHFQLDDGWQQGKSANSAFQGGSFKDIWRKPDYWLPDPKKFPMGFSQIMEAGKKQGITLSTWFNPSVDSSFKYWDRDAQVMIDQYNTYGIRMWKIDGVRIADKQAEINFRKMLDTVMASTHGEAVFNLDVTAGRRFGYHYFYEYGNLFLENRYTDWANYYPHYTLRNLWMLARYVPPQRLQIEFLNKWRNQDRYPKGDNFSPTHYSFDYLFASTIPAQSLAWMEARNLPAEAFAIADLIKAYKNQWQEWHSGQIFPIGDEPSGTSWTGFQSILDQKATGYVLVFREKNKSNTARLKLTDVPPGTYQFTHLMGQGKTVKLKIDSTGHARFTLPKALSYGFYRYQLVN